VITEKSLRKQPHLIKALMGLPPEVFWELMEQLTVRWPDYEQMRLARENRRRAPGAGNEFDQPLTIRVAVVLSYLRLHVPQATVGALYGCQQWDVSRELRRLLPLMQEVLPCPEVWKLIPAEADLPAACRLELEQLTEGRALVDATEQRISRPGDEATQKEYYSGKKKMHTLKTQFVTDQDHHIMAISEALPGKMPDKKLSDQLRTLERLPEECQLAADSGYQGLDKQVAATAGSQAQIAPPDTERARTEPAETEEGAGEGGRSVCLPFKKPKGGELTAEQKAFNQALSRVRVRIEHCLGWVKNWAIIATRFRCAHGIYTSILRTVCGLVNAQTQRWQAAKAAYCA